MIAVITGDINLSVAGTPANWMPHLKKVLNSYGKSPTTWEIYRGDAFQLEIEEPARALWAAIHIKAAVKTVETDVRLSIGFGEKEYADKNITASNGSAFINSGRKFDQLKDEKLNMAISSGKDEFDREMNLLLRFALTIMDEWTAASARLVKLMIEHPEKNQNDMAGMLKINQSAVSQQKKRAQFDLIEDLNKYFAEKVNTIFT